MKVVVSGASGLLGTHLIASMHAGGHDVVALVRGARTVPGAHSVRWDPSTGLPDEAREGADVVVNLAGESIAAKRWSPARREALLSSRLEATSACVAALGAGGPRALVNASAVGYYGATEATVDERDGPGDDFLADLCVRWEHAAMQAPAGTRVTLARFGVVLARDGGALPRLVGLARLGLNGPVGSGRQWVSWVHVDDAVAALELLVTSELVGPFNLVAPHPVRQRELAGALGAILHRPSFLAAPALAVRAAVGSGPASLIIEGQSVAPRALLGEGFSFAHPEIDEALSSLLA